MNFDNLDEQGLQALMSQWELEQQDEDLQRQIAQMNEMRMQAGPTRSTGKAGAIQAAADMLRAYQGKKHEGMLRDERKALAPKITKGRFDFAKGMGYGRGPQPPPQEIDPVTPPALWSAEDEPVEESLPDIIAAIRQPGSPWRR